MKGGIMEAKNIQQEINKTEEKLKELKKKLSEEQNKKDWVKIPELEIEIQKAIHHKNKSYDDLKAEFGEAYLEKHLPTYAQLQFLRNSDKYRELLGLGDSWEFVKQEDLISKKNGYVAWFYMNSGYAGLACGRNSGGSYSAPGVRFVRKILKGSKK